MGDIYGCHRVVQPVGAFPQAAERLDVSLPIFSNEILVRVERLNLDSASFRQIQTQARGDERQMAREIMGIIHARGKMHNPVTNSGGMLLGGIAEVGRDVEGKGYRPGDRIATLVSLTLTPLHLDKIERIDQVTEQVEVVGHAILFESGSIHRLPKDLPEGIALSVFDVCGAPALTAHLLHVGDTVVILGAGKAGVLTAAEARKKTGKGGKIILLEKDARAVEEARSLPFVDAALEADLLDAGGTMKMISGLTAAKMADLVVNCVNVPGTEMASILAAKRSGTVLFFNMATRFQSAVLGAEGIGHETRLVMGNGYYPGHADLALGLVREFPDLRRWFERRFGA